MNNALFHLPDLTYVDSFKWNSLLKPGEKYISRMIQVSGEREESKMTEDIGEFGNVRARATQTPTHQRNISTRKINSQER